MTGGDGVSRRNGAEKGGKNPTGSQQSSKQRRKTKRQKTELIRADGKGGDPNVGSGPLVSGVRMVKVVDHVAARMEEIKLMERRLMEHQAPPMGKMVDLPNRGKPREGSGEGMRLHGGKRAFQKLPKHMRRRAASHNVNRVPSAVRKQAIRERERAEEMRKSGDKKRQHKRTKKPKQKNLEERRVRSGALWLETHVWARKRMHLTLSWGWQLPMRASEKGKRAAYKNFKNVCTAYDMSYYRVVRIGAPAEILKALLSLVTDPTLRPLPHSDLYTKGDREGEMELYRCGGIAHGLIAPVTFVWTNATQLQLWIHPSAAEEAHEELTKALHVIKGTEMDVDSDLGGGSDHSDDIPASVTLLPPGELLRFRITGPRANAVLHSVLKVTEETDATARDAWDTIEFARSCAELADGVCLALDVQDPRHTFPPPPTKLYLSQLEQRRAPGAGAAVCSLVAEWPSGVGHTTLLDGTGQQWHVPSQQEAVRRAGKELEERLTGSAKEDVTMTETETQRGAEVTLSKGEQCEDAVTAGAACFPVLLIQQKNAGGKRNGVAVSSGAGAHLGSGWDVVLPKGWGMPLWVSLIHAGCRVVGLRDSRKLSHEMGRPCFPYDFPDCQAYEKWSTLHSMEVESVYQRKPPGKRVNYAKLSVAFPFSSPWKALVNFWCPTIPEGESLCVLRGYHLRDFEETLANLEYSDRNVLIEEVRERTWELPSEYREVASKLVMVRVEMESSGTIDSCSMLSLPNVTHLDALSAFRAGDSPTQGCEAMKEADRPPFNLPNQAMWSLAASPMPVPLMGFVTSAGHSYALGKGTALAFCPAAALVALAQSSPRRGTWSVLLRTTTHVCHRFARISIAY